MLETDNSLENLDAIIAAREKEFVRLTLLKQHGVGESIVAETKRLDHPILDIVGVDRSVVIVTANALPISVDPHLEVLSRAAPARPRATDAVIDLVELEVEFPLEAVRVMANQLFGFLLPPAMFAIERIGNGIEDS